MQPDLKKYRPYLERYDLTDVEKDQFILDVHAIMEAFVDRAFGTHPLQQYGGKVSANDSNPAVLRVDFENHAHGNDNEEHLLKDSRKTKSPCPQTTNKSP